MQSPLQLERQAIHSWQASECIHQNRSAARVQWARLAVVGGGVVLGFPVLTSFALLGLSWSDLLLFAAVAAAAIGYAEGGLLSLELGTRQSVSWALVVASPIMVLLTAAAISVHPPPGTSATWAAFGYLAVVSMFLGFFAWYRGLSIGPMARVSQVQLVQQVMTITWAALLLHEALTWQTVAGGLLVIACAAGAVVCACGLIPLQRSTLRGAVLTTFSPADKSDTDGRGL